jgi:hypothetical protein
MATKVFVTAGEKASEPRQEMFARDFMPRSREDSWDFSSRFCSHKM